MRHWKEPTGLHPWDELETGAVDKRRVFSVRSDRIRSQQTGDEMLVDRLHSPDWVNVVAITDELDSGAPALLCVRQYRFGIQAMSLEIPAGLVDPGEEAKPAALRELREETGFAPAPGTPVLPLGSVRPNAAFMDNRMTSFAVPQAIRVSEQSLDPHEEVEVVYLPLSELDEAIGAGAFENANSLLSVLRYLHVQRT